MSCTENDPISASLSYIIILYVCGLELVDIIILQQAILLLYSLEVT